jgi:hypothetical protein
MFDVYPTYPRYRILSLTSPYQKGEDVYALQTALAELGFNCGGADGVLGPQTSQAVRTAQQEFILAVDAKAGGATQRTLALEIAQRVAINIHVPYSAFRGQLELESGYRLGNYSPKRPDGSYDAGVAQRNTKFTEPSVGFDTQKSIRELGDVIRRHYDLFSGLPTMRRWALAQGAWNAPAYACYIAREEGATRVTSGMTAKPSSEARQTLEAYVASASVYLAV